MTESEISETAKRIADAVMRGEYGSIEDSGSESQPETSAYGVGGETLKKKAMAFKEMLQTKKGMYTVIGVTAGVILLAGAAYYGYRYMRKKKATS